MRFLMPLLIVLLIPAVGRAQPDSCEKVLGAPATLTWNNQDIRSLSATEVTPLGAPKKIKLSEIKLDGTIYRIRLTGGQFKPLFDSVRTKDEWHIGSSMPERTMQKRKLSCKENLRGLTRVY